MNPGELAELIARGHELPGIEFKPPSLRGKDNFPEVARAMIGMANRRDGGAVIIGVAETPTKELSAIGLSPEQATSWAHDHVASALAPYVDPSITFEVEQVVLDGKVFVVLEVEEFAEVPVVCRKSFCRKGTDFVLREGACYVRSRRKVETVEVSTYEEMRDLIDLATEKSLRRFVQRAHASGFAVEGAELPSADDLYDEERENFR